MAPLTLILLSCFQQALGLKIYGTLPTSPEFIEYVGKFCYDFDPANGVAGLFEFSLDGQVLQESGEEADKNFGRYTEGPPCYGKCETGGSLYLFIYSDESQHWQQAQKEWEELTCEEMSQFASWHMPITPINGNISKIINVRERIRPRFWYFTFAACGVQTVRPLSYEFHMLNPRMGLQQEFGIDEEGLFSLHLTVTILFFTLVCGLRLLARQSSAGVALRSRPILRLLIFSIGCSFMGGFCRVCHYGVFMFDGYGWSFFDIMGQMFVCGARVFIALLFLLTAKGWSLFYGRDELVQRRLTLIIIGLLLIFNASCEIHADYALDWNPSIYLYESWSGVIILVLNSLLFAEAARSMCDTYQKESSEELRMFYMQVSGAALIYFLSLPVLCVLSAAFVPWVRLKYVNRTEVWSRFVASLLLAICLRPSRLDAMVNSRLDDGLVREVEHMRRDPEETQGVEVEGLVEGAE